MRNKRILKQGYAAYIKHFRENETIKQAKIYHNERKLYY